MNSYKDAVNSGRCVMLSECQIAYLRVCSIDNSVCLTVNYNTPTPENSQSQSSTEIASTGCRRQVKLILKSYRKSLVTPSVAKMVI